jgi:hypothetical protein
MDRGDEDSGTYLKAALDWIVAEGLDTTKNRRTDEFKVDKTEWKLRDKFPPRVMKDICTRLGASPNYSPNLTQQLQQSGQPWSYVPKQEDGFNCGVCACMNADFTADDLPLVGMFSQKDLTLLRQKIGTDIMRGALNYTPPTYDE